MSPLFGDDFCVSALAGGWFSDYFENYTLFGYIGNRNFLKDYLPTMRHWLLRWAGHLAPRLSIATVLNKLAPFDLVRADPSGRSIAEEIINLIID